MADWETYNKELEKKSKPRDDLIFPEVFEIKDVEIQTNYATRDYATRNSPPNVEEVLTSFNVISKNKELPIQTIYFTGCTNLQKGDFIKTYLEKYDVKIKKTATDSSPTKNIMALSKDYYLERDFQETEGVKKIEKLNPNNLEEILVTFISK